MRTEIFIPTEKLTISHLEDKDHVGFIDTHGKKAFLIRINSDDFIAVTAYGENIHLCYGSYSSSLQKAIMAVFKQSSYGITELYRFDTRKELYQWLAE